MTVLYDPPLQPPRVTIPEAARVTGRSEWFFKMAIAAGLVKAAPDGTLNLERAQRLAAKRPR